ncbi:Quinohemoprotein alcohol dehydrogenase ADH IIB precursor [compost metagenome]
MIYANNCLACHGVGAMSGGLTPDLRKSDPAIYAAFETIVLKGALEPLGMPNFGKYLTTDDLDKIKAYLVHRRIESFANAKTGAMANSTEASPK